MYVASGAVASPSKAASKGHSQAGNGATAVRGSTSSGLRASKVAAVSSSNATSSKSGARQSSAYSYDRSLVGLPDDTQGNDDPTAFGMGSALAGMFSAAAAAVAADP